jgi:Na+/H+ antiporter NhaD/arsenite permease-like protein
MVASKWNWDFSHMLLHFGYKAALAVTIASLAHALFFFRELKEIPWKTQSTKKKGRPIPLWISLSHLAFLGVIVLASHHPVVFVFTFLFFLGFVTVTKEYQEELRLKEGLLVGFFLGGLVVLGGPQGWWLEPLLSKMDSFILFLGTAGLTAITDNAALTYLGAQVPDLSDTAKYALVSGAVTGGGLTVIANAPNPAGYGILNPHFGISGISPVLLFLFALPPTILAGVCFWLL